ncbi:MAG: hypothetical protein J3K34DRAFT_273823 [Monoraphidium minutum]|nr:MAG: hypothetical protein J3K34DRAFT_273823 [Monoraphidium minutum]
MSICCTVSLAPPVAARAQDKTATAGRALANTDARAACASATVCPPGARGAASMTDAAAPCPELPEDVWCRIVAAVAAHPRNRGRAAGLCALRACSRQLTRAVNRASRRLRFELDAGGAAARPGGAAASSGSSAPGNGGAARGAFRGGGAAAMRHVAARCAAFPGIVSLQLSGVALGERAGAGAPPLLELLVAVCQHCPALRDLQAVAMQRDAAAQLLTALAACALLPAAAGGAGAAGAAQLTSLRLVCREPGHAPLVAAPLRQLAALTRLELLARVDDASGGGWLPPGLLSLRVGSDPALRHCGVGAAWMRAAAGCPRLRELDLWHLTPRDAQLRGPPRVALEEAVCQVRGASAPGAPRARWRRVYIWLSVASRPPWELPVPRTRNEPGPSP